MTTGKIKLTQAQTEVLKKMQAGTQCTYYRSWGSGTSHFSLVGDERMRNINAQIEALRKAGLVNARAGRDGGATLTEAGRAYKIELAPTTTWYGVPDNAAGIGDMLTVEVERVTDSFLHTSEGNALRRSGFPAYSTPIHWYDNRRDAVRCLTRVIEGFAKRSLSQAEEAIEALRQKLQRAEGELPGLRGRYEAAQDTARAILEAEGLAEEGREQ